jgi:excisionase family DNA binding protein
MIIIQLDSEQLSNLIQSSVRKVLKDTITPPATEAVGQQGQVMTVKEAAKYLSLTVPTIYSKVSKGELPVMKRGKRLYFSLPELLAYLKGGRKKSNAEIEAEVQAYISSNKKGLNNGR